MTAKKGLKIAALITGSLFLLLLVSVIVINAVVVQSTKGRIASEPQADIAYDAIVVLGAGLRSDGTPSDMLRDRLDGAIALLEAGASGKILLTGDRSGEDYDEVGAMYAYCLNAGVSEDALFCDPEGFSTYESMENALSTLGFRRVMIVTQQYHLYRALYVANAMGADADGFAADYHTYRGQAFRNVREYAARVKDFLKVTF